MKHDDPWQELYEAAILETDDAELPKRLLAAQAAIAARVKELHMDHGGTAEERSAIGDAHTGLNVLRRELHARGQETGSSKA